MNDTVDKGPIFRPLLGATQYTQAFPGFHLPRFPLLGLSVNPIIKVIMVFASSHLDWEEGGPWQVGDSHADRWLLMIHAAKHSTAYCIPVICDTVFSAVRRWPKSPTRW